MLFFEIPVRGHSTFERSTLFLFCGIWLYLFLNLEDCWINISSEWSLLPTVYDTITIQFWVFPLLDSVVSLKNRHYRMRPIHETSFQSSCTTIILQKLELVELAVNRYV